MGQSCFSIKQMPDDLTSLLRKFERAITTADWGRFKAYARRVRSLTYLGHNQFCGRVAPLSPDLILQFLLFCPEPRSSVLPNLNSLEWWIEDGGPALSLIPFTASTLTRLDITLEWKDSESPPEEYADLLKALVSRSMQLEEFSLWANECQGEMDMDLSDTLRQQHQLKAIWLAPYLLTARVVEALASLQYLKDVSRYYLWSHYQHPVDSGTCFGWSKENFPALEDPAFVSSLPSAIATIDSSPRPQLRGLRLHLEPSNTTAEFSVLAVAIATNCFNLKTLHISLFASPVGAEVIDMHSLAPLLGCERLEDLAFGQRVPVVLTEDDIVRMGAAWKQMRQLCLCADPMEHRDGSGWDLSVLEVFARHFHRLKTLQIYVRAHTPPVHKKFKFECLETLNFGTSPESVYGEQACAVYISRVCPLDTKVVARQTIDREVFVNPRTDALQPDPFWNAVASMTACIQGEKRLLKNERDKLEQQVKALQARFGLLVSHT